MEEKKNQPQSPQPKPGNAFVPLFLVVIFILIFIFGQQAFNPKKDLTLPKFWNWLESNSIKKLTINGLEGTVQKKEGDLKNKQTIYKIYFHSKDHVKDVLAKIESLRGQKKVELEYIVEPNNTWFSTMLVTLLPILILIFFLWFFIFRQLRVPGGAGNMLSFGKTKARMINHDEHKITFKDVAGAEEAKEEVTELVRFLKDPKKFSRLGGRIPRGVLMVGSPGTGKTLLAKAIAGEAKVPFFSISGSDFVEMFVGVGASRVRDLFKQAQENSPCLIFLDEIDAVGRRRGSGLGGGHDEREQTLNAILVEMDGFNTDEGIIVLAATNRPDVLDPALLRPGRFDRQIVMHLPDLEARAQILKVHAEKIKLGPDVDLTVVARGTPGFSGAELAAIVNEAAILATMQDKHFVELEDLEEARDRVRFGRSKSSRMKHLEEDELRDTAYHEAGHAVLAKLLPNVEPIHKVTIVPRGMAAGMMMQLPKKDPRTPKMKALLSRIAICYGGRIAEKHFCEDISAGAVNDIEQATNMARAMVCEWGMSDALGPVKYSEPRGHVFLGKEIGQPKEFSDETALKIDQEIRRILEEQYKRAEQLILDHKDNLTNIAESLLKYETLTAEDVDIIMEGGDLEAARKKREDEATAKKEKAIKEQEAREKAEREAKEKAEREAREKAEREGVIGVDTPLTDSKKKTSEKKDDDTSTSSAPEKSEKTSEKKDDDTSTSSAPEKSGGDSSKSEETSEKKDGEKPSETKSEESKPEASQGEDKSGSSDEKTAGSSPEEVKAEASGSSEGDEKK